MKKTIILLILTIMFFTGCTLSRQETPDRVQGNPGALEDITKDPSESSRQINEDQTGSSAQDENQEPLDSAMNGTGWELVPSQAAEIHVSPDEARAIAIPSGDHASLDISFAEGSVSEDTVFKVTPLTAGGYPGFVLEEKGAEGNVLIDYPAGICYMTTEEIPDDLRIVKLDKNGGIDAIMPCYRIKAGDCNGLMTFVNSFSAYGVKRVSRADIDHAAYWHEKYGFDWILEVEDQYKIIAPEGTELFFGCQMRMVNKSAPSLLTMQGPYHGEAIFLYGGVETNTGAFVEGMEVPLVFAYSESDRNASLTLYPIFSREEEESGLIRLNLKDFAGKGILNLSVDMFEFMGEEFNEDDEGFVENEPEPCPVSVITRGPIAYVNVPYPMLGTLKFKGSIVGHARKTEEELPARIEPVPLNYNSPLNDFSLEDDTVDFDGDGSQDTGIRQNSDGDLEYDGDGDNHTDITISEDSDGKIYYDYDGDGQGDIEIVPLVP